MIYISADDYGLCDAASAHIQKCIDVGALNKVSVFPNFDKLDLYKITDNNKRTSISLHLNLVEGKCVTDKDDISMIVDKNGNFKYTFGGLFKLSLLHKKAFEEQIYKEIKAQIMLWKNILPADTPFYIDSHQHTHMIPSVFKTLIKVLNDENIHLEYMRIPTEPLSPYLATPSLYFTYKPINIIKQWLLNLLWLADKKYVGNFRIHASDFMGILFSGNMDYKRINKILPKYIKKAEKDGRDIEILFHPGYLDKKEPDFEKKNVVFEKFYLSKNRKTEFDSAIKISEGSVL